MDERFAKLKEMLRAAMEEAPANRDARLVKAAGGDADLLEEARRKLRRIDDAPDLFRTAGIDPFLGDLVETMPVPEPGEPGRTIGPYRLLEVLGEGGMGTVYLAEQSEPIRRRVALKLIKLGMDTREVVARFEAERQAMAMMDHPGVAKVFDAGATDEGRPYFVMEFVRGEPINAYCDRLRLGLEDRLRLFAEVCRAIHHAHQKGIIHRDVKPSNILVTQVEGKPVPKVIDFGIAKAVDQRLTEKTVFTRWGQLVGTPEYMSPEQADPGVEDIDTTTDVYSLGVVLYELIAGGLPFEPSELREGGWREIQRRIREGEPPRPSTKVSSMGRAAAEIASRRRLSVAALEKRLRGELDWIILRSMDKERARRYASASELAADITRFVKNEPIVARPPSAAYLIGKMIERHRGAFAIVAAVVLLVLGFGIWVSVLYARAEAARGDAVVARDEAESVTEFLSSTLWAASPGEQGADVTLREVLDETAAKIDRGFEESPLVEARLRTTIGNAYRELGEYGASEEQITRALEIQRRELGGDHPLVLGSMSNLGYLLTRQGRLAEAESLHVAALEKQRLVLDPADPDLLASMNNLALLHTRQGRFDEAAPLQREVADARRRALGDDHPRTLNTLNTLAISCFRMQRFAEAESLWQAVLDGRRRALEPDHPDVLQSLNNMAAFFATMGRLDEAEPLFGEVVEIQERVLGPEHPKTMVTMRNLGTLYGDLGRFEEAVDAYRAVLKPQVEVLGERHPDVILTKSNLAGSLIELGRYDEAEPLARQAVELSREVTPDDRWSLGIHQSNLGGCYVGLGRLQEAEPELLAAYDLLVETHDPEGHRVAQCVDRLVALYEAWGRPDDAASWRDRRPDAGE